MKILSYLAPNSYLDLSSMNHSNIYVMTILLIGLFYIILIAIPLISHGWEYTRWRYDAGDFKYYRASTDDEILSNDRVLLAPYFRDSLIFGAAIAIPILIDAVADTIASHEICSLRAIFLIGLNIPNVIFLIVDCSPGFSVVMIQCRVVFCACICQIQLCRYGGKTFCNWQFVMTSLIINFCGVLSCWCSFSKTFFNLYLLLFYICFLMGTILFLRFVYLWYHLLSSRRSYNDITNLERSCSVYLMAFGGGCSGLIILFFLFGALNDMRENSYFLASYTFIDICVMLYIWFFHGRILRLDMIHTKVSFYIYIYIYIYIFLS